MVNSSQALKLAMEENERLNNEIEVLEARLNAMESKYEQIVDTYLKIDRLFVEYAWELKNIEKAEKVNRINKS